MSIDFLIKVVSLSFLAGIALISAAIYGYDLVTNRSIPPIVVSVVGAGVGYALHSLGVINGASNTLKAVQAINGTDDSHS